MAIPVGIQKTVEVQAKEIQLHLKVRDEFTASIVDAEGAVICTQEDDYVPSLMPGEHYGDYVILNIDLESGVVTNWVKPSAQEVLDFIADCNKDEAHA